MKRIMQAKGCIPKMIACFHTSRSIITENINQYCPKIANYFHLSE